MAPSRSVRYKKLTVKSALPVLREDQVDPNDYEALTTESHIATGVEQAEESEYHLQAVLQTSGVSADKEIPVPPPQESDVDYDALYSALAPQPTNYIRFSQTVEECIGCQYDMTEDDDAFLIAYNQKRPAAASQLSEDVFEQIMEVYEDTASVSTPFAAVDKTVVPYDMMVPGLNRLESPKVMSHAKEIYEYWKSQRQAKGGPLHPSLKFETHQESDEMDPYVCFRRREVRQTRKTRARDVQSAEKLKRLRRELEDGRQLVVLSYEREIMKRESLNVDRMIFEQRAKIKEAKIRLGIKADDDDLWSLKKEKRKASDLPLVRPPGPTHLRLPARPDGRSAEADLTQLRDVLAEKETELRTEIQSKIENHRKWNLNHIDLTREPLGPVKGGNVELSFRPATTQYLMTPPASASSESLEEPVPMDLDQKEETAPPVMYFKGVTPRDTGSSHVSQPAFRRRIGRLNRLWIDRRGLASPPREAATTPGEYSDRWKYDQDDSDDEPPQYEVDPYDLHALKFRASIPLYNPIYNRRPDPAMVNGAALTNGVGPAGRPALPAPPAAPPAGTPAASQAAPPAS